MKVGIFFIPKCYSFHWAYWNYRETTTYISGVAWSAKGVNNNRHIH